MAALSHRYDFVYFFDVSNGNPNGDPDAGNFPRMDPETSHGLVSDVSIKRKIRNYIAEAKSGIAGYAIYVREGSVLNEQHRLAYRAIRGRDKRVDSEAKLSPTDDDEAGALVRWMCANFFDVRTFGAVMSTGINCGQVRGPLQFAFARSVEPVLPVEITITRMAATNDAEQKRLNDSGGVRSGNRTMARKHIVPYGLYRVHGFVNAKLAQRTGFSEDDLELVKRSLAGMYDLDRSAARGDMAARHCIAFRHKSDLGNAQAHVLFDRVKVYRRQKDATIPVSDRPADDWPPARSYEDYEIRLDKEDLPLGITVEQWI